MAHCQRSPDLIKIHAVEKALGIRDTDSNDSEKPCLTLSSGRELTSANQIC